MYLEKLNNLLNDLDSIIKINHGGCCYIAYLIARNCEYRNIKYQVVIRDSDITPKDTRKYYSKIKRRASGGIFPDDQYACNHIYIRIKGININPDGDYGDENECVMNLNSKDLLWIYRMGEWNESYDTTNNSILSKFINIICEKVL